MEPITEAVEAVQISKRIPGLENVIEIPRYFFTLADEKESALQLIRALQLKYPIQLGIRAEIFSGAAEAEAHLTKHGSHGTSGVFIFTDKRVGGCFSYLFRDDDRHRARFPSWSRVTWGIGLHRPLPSSRIMSIAEQLSATFQTHYLPRIKEGMLPWGPLPVQKLPTAHFEKRPQRTWL